MPDEPIETLKPIELTDREIGLLYEIYEMTFRDYTVVAGGRGQSRLMPDIYSSGASVRDRLVNAIKEINECESEVVLVRSILTEYEDFRLDPSKIKQAGYNFNPPDNLRVVRDRLYSYTGILFNFERSQGFNIG